ncbi:MAG: twin-arginine translocase subunit TatC [Bacteroidales bacterium]|nr:twin-arginine translocase subunit TatC [Bacteroidales bacterium]MBQ8460827.1 twin-arginine translocase subunit TatC [Bacteroidales bacterium]MCR5363045.1 twin-arginine translocase subunit TatC [Bacteroidales bacterium]
MTFWDHLDVLRGTLIRIVVAVLLVSVAIFCMKSWVFDGLIFAPTRPDFFVYKWLKADVNIQLVNLDISAQFFTHIKVSLMLGLVAAFPYIVYELWKFIAPALYQNEKSAVKKAFGFASLLFYIGVAVGYIFVFPVTLQFFQGYSISDSLTNNFSLQSYISMLTSMVLLFGIVFEFPSVLAVLSKMGLVTRSSLRKYRRHALVGILVVAAIITPADPVSMLIAAAPLYLLYELSVFVCAKDNK